MSDKTVLKNVQQQYAAVAKSNLSNESEAVRSVAQAFGYSAEELASLPSQAMGLSCGNGSSSVTRRAAGGTQFVKSGSHRPLYGNATWKTVTVTGRPEGTKLTLLSSAAIFE